MTLDSFTTMAPELGWHFTGYQYSFTADFAAGTRDVVVTDNREGDVQACPGRHRPAGRPERFLHSLRHLCFTGLGEPDPSHPGEESHDSLVSPFGRDSRSHQERQQSLRNIHHTTGNTPC